MYSQVLTKVLKGEGACNLMMQGPQHCRAARLAQVWISLSKVEDLAPGPRESLFRFERSEDPESHSLLWMDLIRKSRQGSHSASLSVVRAKIEVLPPLPSSRAAELSQRVIEVVLCVTLWGWA